MVCIVCLESDRNVLAEQIERDMPVDTNVVVDVRNLFSVRVVRFDVHEGSYVDVSFELQADKTRATLRIAIPYGKFSDTNLAPDSTVKMTALDGAGKLKEFDVIKQDAWEVVLNTTADNKTSSQGTHADVSWSEVREWALLETKKPSVSHTLNTI